MGVARESFRSELDCLGTDIEDLGERVLDQLEDAQAVYESGDDELAARVIERDAVINETTLTLESRCVDLLALQQPVASDLRFVVASFKILTDLERVGDLATSIARYGRTAGSNELFDVDVARIGRDARSMVAEALDAYGERDPEACHRVVGLDEDLDAACHRAGGRVLRGLIERRGSADGWPVETNLEAVSRLLLTIRDVERIGDHAENIAARTYYAVEGDPSLLA
jgi:phosphate transport system protein